MKKKKLVIFGTDDFAQLAKFYFTADSEYEVCGFVVDKEYLIEDSFCNLPAVALEDAEEKFPPSEYDMFIAIAYTHLNEVREQKYHEYKRRGYKLASYISSKATCWYEGNEFGDNVFVFEDNTIQPYAKIGSNTILWSGNHIGHHAEIGNHVFITSQVVIAGRVVIGDNTFIGINATINDHIRIAERNIIGARALIARNTKPNSMYVDKITKKVLQNVNDSTFFFGKSVKSVGGDKDGV
ncbi:acetyltransferase [Anaerovibrio sp.]|uniref:acetyltransferase n=1 Tax=Anaerovibrio sp. TaxID=1872532 RepID=UPI00388CF458